MAPRNRQKQLSKGRYKQTFRGPVRSSNPSFTALETTPTKDTCQTNEPASTMMSHITTPTTTHGTSGGNCVNGDDFDEEGLEDSDMLALEGPLPMKAPVRAKSFAWSDADSTSRRSSPALAGETPQANWELDDVDTIPNPYSSPGSGTGTYPSTMPLQQSHLAALLPDTVKLTEPPFDFSETASTTRRSTPFEAHSIQDAAWELGESNSVTPRTSRHSPDSTSSHSTDDHGSESAAKRPENSRKNDGSFANIETPGNRGSLREGAGVSNSEKPSQGLRGQGSSRRKQRPKTPIYIDESTQRDSNVSAHLGDEPTLSGAKTSITSHETFKAVGKHDTVKRKNKASESSRSRKKGKKLSDESKSRDLDLSWEPPQTTRKCPAASRPSGHPETEPEPASSAGPAANTRARGKGVQRAIQTAIGKHEAQLPIPPLESPLSDPPSTQSSRKISSDDLHFSSPEELGSTYFLDDSEPRLGAEPGQFASPTKMSPVRAETSVRRSSIGDSSSSDPGNEIVDQEKVQTNIGQSKFGHSPGSRPTEYSEPLASLISTQRPPVRIAGKLQQRVSIELSSDSDTGSSCDDLGTEDIARQTQVKRQATQNAQQDRAGLPEVSERDKSPRRMPLPSEFPKVSLMHDRPKEDKHCMASRVQKRPSGPSFNLDLDEIEDETDFRPAANTKTPDLPRMSDQAQKKHNNRIFSIGVDGSPGLAPVIESNDIWHAQSAEQISILDDGPIKLRYSGRPSESEESEDPPSSSGHFNQPARVSFAPNTNQRPKKNADNDRAPLAHLSREAATLLKGVDMRLQSLAKDLHAVDEVYDIKMKRCLSKIIGTAYEERRRIEKANRQNVKRFRSLVDKARQTVQQQVSDRRMALGNMNRTWAQRASVYDDALQGLERLSSALGRETASSLG